MNILFLDGQAQARNGDASTWTWWWWPRQNGRGHSDAGWPWHHGPGPGLARGMGPWGAWLERRYWQGLWCADNKPSYITCLNLPSAPTIFLYAYCISSICLTFFPHKH